jgi:hypothetical protein
MQMYASPHLYYSLAPTYLDVAWSAQRQLQLLMMNADPKEMNHPIVEIDSLRFSMRIQCVVICRQENEQEQEQTW